MLKLSKAAVPDVSGIGICRLVLLFDELDLTSSCEALLIKYIAVKSQILGVGFFRRDLKRVAKSLAIMSLTWSHVCAFLDFKMTFSKNS